MVKQIEPAPKPAEVQRPVVPEAGLVAYDFTLETLDGEKITLSDLRGKPVMLNFWATWCAPCRFEIPYMIAAYEEYQDDGLQVLAVNLREEAGAVRRYAERAGMNFTIALDSQGEIGAAYFVRAIPTSLFIDQEGVIQAVHRGTLSEEALRGYLATLLQQ